MDRTRLAMIGATFCVVIWGLTFIFSKHLMTFYTPTQLMSMRFLIALVMLWMIRPKWSFDIRTEWAFVLMALFGNVIYFLTENMALTYTYTSEVCILTSTTSIMSLVLMHLIFKDPVGKRQVIGFLLALIGVALVAFNGAIILDLDPIGDVLALTSALSWAVYGIILRLYNREVDSVILTRKTMFYGLLISIPLLIIEGKSFDPSHLLEPINMFSLFFLGGLGSCLCFMLWNHGIKAMGVIRANIFIYAMPVVTLIAGSIVFDETIAVMAVIGMALVISGMLMANGSYDVDGTG